MVERFPVRAAAVALGVLLLSASLARAEVVEEIVAWVNGDIITKSQLDEEEKALTEEAYQRFSGTELDEQLKQAREGLLRQMIDRRILVDRASRMYDLKKMGDGLVDEFWSKQNVPEDQRDRMLAQAGFTRETLRERLIEQAAPDYVIHAEVSNRVSVGENEVQAYFEAHKEQFRKPVEFTVREIVLMADTPEAKARRRDEAQKVRDRATADGADFAAIAKEVSEAGTKDSGGLLGPLKKGELNAALENQALDLPVGAVSPVIETPYGFHIIKVESRTGGEEPTLDAVHDQVQGYLQNQKFIETLNAFLKKARDEADWHVNPKYEDRLH